MCARRAILTVACTGVALAGAHFAQAQEASSANLPDQFQTDEMIQSQKPKKKGATSNSESLTTEPKQKTASAPNQPVAAKQLQPAIVPLAEKKDETTPVAAAMPSSQTAPHPMEQTIPPHESPPAIAPVKKPRRKKRPLLHVESGPADVSAPVPMSLAVAQSMAISAPLPEYSYEAKRRNLAGSGICLVTVDVATGRVTDAKMYQSTGSAILDTLTVQTFKSWRFKPGTLSQVRLPVSYE